MANKVDSNFTGLRYAEEQTLGVLPGSPVWQPLDPNSYSDFGSSLTLLARNPINSSSQRKKGVITDLDASGGFNQDFTQTNLYDILQGFMFASWEKKASQASTAVDGTTERYSIASTTGFNVGGLVEASGHALAANNGLKSINAVIFNTQIDVDQDLTTETPPAAAKVKVVGHQFGSNALSMDVTTDPTKPALTVTAPVAATGTLTAAGNVANNDTVTIGTQTYTFKTALTPAANEILIGATALDSLTNLARAINGGAGSGTLYGAGTAVNAYVTATEASPLVATAKVAGVTGNSIPTTEVSANLSWGGATLSGGTGVSFLGLDLELGDWVWIGGDSALLRFSNAANRGFARVYAITASRLSFDKTMNTFVTEVGGGGQTIQLFVADRLHNQDDPDLIVRRTYQLERDLDVGGSEYLIGATPATLSFNVNGQDKVNVDLTFVATDNEQRTTVQGLKSGTRPSLVEESAFNTSSDFTRLRLCKSDGTALFAYLTELAIQIDNNVTPNKAVSVLGAFDVTAGTFAVDGSMTAYFADVTAVQAVRNNEDVSLDLALVKDNAGWVVDVPHVALGDGRLRVEQDQPITLPLTTAAARHPTLLYTLKMLSFDYLPDLAE